ncbi:MAG: D-alanyl-D-alanine carboxypeptidase [Rickettsiales bacterium]|nr:D-alanyl-D-alanine carboxypeptidase [Rickettsiales bacterium]
MIIRVICILFLLIGNVFAFETTAKQAILIDFNTNEVLFEQNADEKSFPSSMTKIMTAYLIFEKLNDGRLNLQDKLQISNEAWQQEGSRMFLNIGTQVSVDELLKGLLIVSGNDSAVALAEGSCGSTDEFVNQMNKKAEELNLKNTHFTNPVGFSEENHFMSVKDISALSRDLIRDFPNYYAKYFPIKEYKYNNILQPNRNQLLGKFDGVDGIKTGHTEDGGYGIVLSAKQGDRRLIAVLNGMNSETERTEEGRKILTYGFNGLARYKIYEQGEIVKEVPVLYGKNKTAKITVNQNIFGTAENKNNISTDISINNQLKAPLSANQKVGTLTVKSLNNVIQYDLVNEDEIKQVNIFIRFFLEIFYFFSNLF